MRKILESKALAFVLFLTACWVTYTQNEVTGAIIFLTVICLQLVFCENTFATLSPFLMMCVFVCTCYDSFKVFIVYLPLAPIAVMCVIYHFVVYRKPFTLGETFLPLCMVACAITLGGLGTIPAKDYFAPGVLFYTFGLGFGMVLLYLILRSRYVSSDPEMSKKLGERFAFDMYLMGLVTVACVVSFYLRDVNTWLVEHKPIIFQAKNNFSTFLMLAMPFPLYFTMNREEKCSGGKIFRVSDLHFLSFVLMYIAILLTGSRGGLVFGTVEFLVCFAFAVFNREGRRKIPYLSAALCAVVCAVFVEGFLFEQIRERFASGLASSEEQRSDLLFRAIDDFKRNVIFGSGFGYQGNSDLYNPVKGAMNWYHIYPAQIIGSFGLTGIIAFGAMIVQRFMLFLRRPDAFKLTLGLSYIAILMMSMVNPGEFCPIPYEMTVVLIFIFLEKTVARPTFSAEKLLKAKIHTDNEEIR